MNRQYLNPAEAARRLGVSPKALRLYEQRGLLKPARTEAGWRAYGPEELVRAGEVAALRALGLSLAQTARVLQGDPADLGPALAAHQAGLEVRLGETAAVIARVRALRAGLAEGRVPTSADLANLTGRGHAAAFGLPWPWGGERFELPALGALTWIVGPLGSGKTRLARAIAEALPDAGFLPLERPGVRPSAKEAEAALAWLEGEGAVRCEALSLLMGALTAGRPAALVVDMVEQGLEQPAQEALAAWLRRRGPGARPLVLMTRSSAMLDLELAGPDETLIYCPANHSPPLFVPPHPGAPGYEALAGCLAPPSVRARTEGMIAVQPKVA